MMASFARARLRGLAIGVVVVLAVAVALSVDARARSDRGDAARERDAVIARVTGLPDLALSTSSSWLRHPSLAPPSAGAADAPFGLDVDPAGAVITRRAHERAIDMAHEAP